LDGTNAAAAPARRALGLGLLGLAGILALAYLRVLFADETFAVRDHLAWTLPSRAFLAESLRQGHLPEWWDALRLGQRFAVDPNNGVTYPLAWMVALVDPLLGADLLLLLHVFLVGAGGVLFARRLGASPLGAFFGGATLMASGYVSSMLVNGTVLLPMGWMPLLAWAALGIAQAEKCSVRLQQGLICAGIVAGGVASGNPTGVYNVLLAVAIVLLTARRRFAATATLAGAGLLGVLMGAASLLVPLLALPESTRAGGLSLADSGVWSMHPLRLIEFIWPDLLGQGLRPECNLADFWVNSGGLGGNWSASDYVGLPVLVCAAVAAVRGGAIARRLAYLSLFFLLLALGTYTPLYGLYRAVFRFEHILRYPEKHLASVLVLWSALAAIGIDRLFDATVRWKRLARACLCLAGLLAVCLGVGHLVSGRLSEAIVRAGLAQGRGIDARAALSYVFEGGLVALALTVFVPLTLWLAKHPRLGRFARPGFVFFAVVQLAAHDISLHVLVSREIMRNTPAILSRLPLPAQGEFPRVLHRSRDITPVTVSGEMRAALLHQVVTENVATRFGFGQVPGYTIAGTQRFEALAAASGKANLERVMDLLDIRYLIIEAAQAGAMGMPMATPGVFAGLVVLENEVRRPRAFVAYRHWRGLADEQVLEKLFASHRSAVDFGAIHLSGPGESQTSATEEPSRCDIERPVPEHVILHCQAVRAGYAVLLDEWTHGWSATVDGVAASIERADVVFRAVAVPPGSHRVEMRYQTPGLRTGAALSLAGCLIYLVLVCATVFASRWLASGRLRLCRSIDGEAPRR
jgi:hypothetical protein